MDKCAYCKLKLSSYQWDVNIIDEGWLVAKRYCSKECRQADYDFHFMPNLR